ncbi:inorganic phosphate transporter, PiT family [Enhydrobacter aerosaccus]|uniref:Phosphate transporter n=1 Tax=Enhydrobacter aerosaccus TaxID=225324 RepID=A0A1T4JRH9_9HYPH|nr:inorganic phosphate transporter [Enhydrobacter aerosaccus]SJZ32744.1 inorganic phosphate transporter, PiT family [Enhydrobacter aerosaccus]
MESFFGSPVGIGTIVLLGGALLLALSFEFVNGFHDTANAVATVIYTHTLSPMQAVIWSGAWNFLGVLTSTGAVAFGIVALLPVELILNVGSGAGFAMVFSLLLSAIIWNVGTWYLGLPASSSHTLIGSIVGVGLMNSLLADGQQFGEGVNWAKVQDTAMALLVSPVVGFVCAALLLLLAKALIRNPALYRSPEGKNPPPWWIRGILVLTCTGVSFAHGSNDGQKGMGLIMLILIGIVPATYALDLTTSPERLQTIVAASHAAAPVFAKGGPAATDNQAANAELSRFLTSSQPTPQTLPALALKNDNIAREAARVSSLADLAVNDRSQLRRDIYLVEQCIGRMSKLGLTLDSKDKATLTALRSGLEKLTDFIPLWVKIAVAVALGLGTTIGWKRIVVTVGEKIGKSHLTYAQGASAEVVAMLTIGAADTYGLPVSTTHILSSGIAGTMAANASGLQKETLRNILLAWVLTLPACMILGSVLFAAGLFVVLQRF